MGDADKPFACTEMGCGMKFVLEDHLTMHKRKHDMSLELTTSSILNKNSFVDQTPTPTRFIKNCDAVGLFQDLQHLTVNPFDEEFRRASQSGTNPQTVDRVADEDSLNTPTVIPLTTERQMAPAEPETAQVPIFPVDEEMESQQFSISETNRKDVVQSDERPQVKELLTQPVIQMYKSSNVAVLPKKAIRTSNVPVPMVIRSQITNIAPNVTNHVTTGIPVVTTVQSQVVQQPLPVTLIIKMADGQSQYLTTTGITSQPVLSNICKAPVDTTSHIPTTVKLKAALHSRASKITANPSTGTCKSNDLYARDLYASLNHKNLAVNRVGPVATVQPTFRSSSSGRRMREEEENPDEKRVKFLERNRAAAARCRTRKKQWVVALQRKADELSSTNEHLQKEVAMLRNEVAKLKTMLLAHKDCPITQQQRAAGHPDAISIEVPTFCPPLLTPANSGDNGSVFVDTFEIEVSSSDNSCDSKSLPGSSE